MRQRIVPIFERYKVDLVLSGHSHCYERSYLINGHYGTETTFTPATHALSSSSAKYDGTANSCIYTKNSTSLVNGIVYTVVGSAGQLDASTSGYPHNAMYYSNITNGGVLFFEVEGNRLDAKWICADGVTRDNFTIMKDVNKTINLSIPSGTPTQLTASWIGNYSWNTAETTRTITVSPSSNTTYTVTDGASCLTDVFNITISGNQRNRFTEPGLENAANAVLKIIPTLVHRGERISVNSNSNQKLVASVVDISGRVIQTYSFSQTLYIPTEKLKAGVYFIRINNRKSPAQKITILE
jgi:hypothetical protein